MVQTGKQDRTPISFCGPPLPTRRTCGGAGAGTGAAGLALVGLRESDFLYLDRDINKPPPPPSAASSASTRARRRPSLHPNSTADGNSPLNCFLVPAAVSSRSRACPVTLPPPSQPPSPAPLRRRPNCPRTKDIVHRIACNWPRFYHWDHTHTTAQPQIPDTCIGDSIVLTLSFVCPADRSPPYEVSIHQTSLNFLLPPQPVASLPTPTSQDRTLHPHFLHCILQLHDFDTCLPFSLLSWSE